MTPSVEPVYDDRIIVIGIMIFVIVLLFTTTMWFLGLWLSNRKSNKENNTTVAQPKPTTTTEIEILEQYNKLNNKDKALIKNMIKTLNENNNENKE